MKYLGNCKDIKLKLKNLPECCEYCHDETDPKDPRLLHVKTKGGFYYVCCKVEKAFLDFVNGPKDEADEEDDSLCS